MSVFSAEMLDHHIAAIFHRTSAPAIAIPKKMQLTMD